MCAAFIAPLGGSSMKFHWVPLCACLSLFVVIYVCVHFLAFVCTFPLLTGWPAAVLESLLTESVGSVGYFYPLACVRKQVEALWATTRSHGDKHRYAAICSCSGQTSRSKCPFFKVTACDESKGFRGQMEELIFKTLHSFVGEKTKKQNLSWRVFFRGL